MKTIKLTKGFFVKVDDEDFEYFNQYKWAACGTGKHIYARRWLGRDQTGKRISVALYSQLIEVPKGFVVDHINGDTLDCQKQNLRACSQSDNRKNSRKGKTGKSKFKGVTWSPGKKCWSVSIHIQLGAFSTEEEAARCYDEYARSAYKEYARLNFPKEGECPAL